MRYWSEDCFVVCCHTFREGTKLNSIYVTVLPAVGEQEGTFCTTVDYQPAFGV